jgi:hypothetical protein
MFEEECGIKKREKYSGWRQWGENGEGKIFCLGHRDHVI